MKSIEKSDIRRLTPEEQLSIYIQNLKGVIESYQLELKRAENCLRDLQLHQVDEKKDESSLKKIH